MKIVDLTHKMYGDMPTYSEGEKPFFSRISNIEKDGYNMSRIEMQSHIGTHIDAPLHMVENGLSLDKMPVDSFIGKAVVINVSSEKFYNIELSLLMEQEDKIRKAEFLLFNTGWSRLWGDKTYFAKSPYLTKTAAEWLLQFDLKGVGIDTMSIDSMESVSWPTHKILFKQNILIVENLANLDAVTEGVFTFSCLPLKYEGADGSPVRAVAIL